MYLTQIVQSFALDPHASYPTATSRGRLTVIKLQDNVTVCKVIQVKLAIVKMGFIIATLRLLFVENQQQHVTAGTNTIDKTLIAKVQLIESCSCLLYFWYYFLIIFHKMIADKQISSYKYKLFLSVRLLQEKAQYFVYHSITKKIILSKIHLQRICHF